MVYGLCACGRESERETHWIFCESRHCLRRFLVHVRAMDGSKKGEERGNIEHKRPSVLDIKVIRAKRQNDEV